MGEIFSQKNRNAQEGFSLVELMVSLTVFSVVMLVSTGTLLIMIDINAKAQAVYSSTTNLTFAIDNITRELRTGYHYLCYREELPLPSDPVSLGRFDCNEGLNANAISFTREKDKYRVEFRHNGSMIEQKIDNLDGSEGDTVWVPLTSDDVVVENLSFVVSGAWRNYLDDGDTNQPTVKINISGYVNNGLDENTSFSIQSKIIQRRLDII
jgi:prepilin-type N-terminal cleavage/methylation domain-containing protein